MHRPTSRSTGNSERAAAAPGAEASAERKAAIRDAEEAAEDKAGALFARRCAKGSCAYTLLLLPLGAWMNQQAPKDRLAHAIAGCGVFIGAVGLGIYALTRVSRYGRAGLLLPACVALGFNGFGIGMAVWQLLDP